MKTRILLTLLLVSSFGFAQTPTDDSMRYLFTGGSLVNDANPGTGDLTQTGTAATFIADFDGNTGNAAQLNGDSFVGGQTAAADNREITISFWMKSAPPTSTSYERIIQVYGSGGRGIRIEHRLSGSNYIFGYYGTADNNLGREIYANSIGLYDNQWHHVALRTSEFYPSGDETIPVEMYIDGIRNATLSDQQFNSAAAYFPPFLSNGTLTVAPSGNYQGGIDDIRLFERALSDTEIAALSEDGIKNIIYVDLNATGANDGTSWSNAYADLQNAITNVQTDTDEIWIAQGTYKPDASDRAIYFNFNKANLKIYGGFNGESDPANRDLLNNHTILSGDIDGDGGSSNNSYHIVRASSNSMIFDGLTITGGNASDSSGFNSYGSALYKSNGVRDLTIRNCNINRNNNYTTGAIYTRYSSNTRGVLTIDNTTIEANNARYGSGFYSYLDYNTFVKTNITNCLFSRNTTFQTNTAYSASAAWLREAGAGSVNRVNITNCTFAKNNNRGTQYVNTRGVLGISGTNSAMQANVSNCIFYGNLDSYGTNNVAIAINGISANLTALVKVYNAIDEDDFSTVSNANKVNTSNSDPLFLDVDNNNFTLLPGSPALDTGDNSKLPTNATKDLFYNNRIFNTNVDMGCYEIQTTNTYDLTIQPTVGSGTLSPIPGTYTYFEGTEVSVVPTADFGWVFDSWSGDATGNLNPLTVTMNSDKDITATFSAAPEVYVDLDATGNNDGSSWADAYTTIENAIASGNSAEFWVAEGVYRPANILFISNEGTTIYGGFNATETQLSERDVLAHETIISGDVNNDDTGVDFTGQNRTENLQHVVWINANDITLDGLTIQDGHADAASGNNSSGSAIYKTFSMSDVILKNCTLKNNVSNSAGAIFARYSTDGTLQIENCIFDNNLSRYGVGIYSYSDANYTVTVNIVNTLFSNNSAIDSPIGTSYSGALWLRANGANSAYTTTITNSTFANNTGTGTNTNSSEKAALGLDRTSTAVHNAAISNCIFYGNTDGTSSTFSIGKIGNSLVATSVAVNNAIGEDNFSNLTLLTNTSNVNPMFVDAANNDFTLMSGSSAIDTGDNSKIPTGINTDLLGNDRIFNTTVDMGVYEFGSTLGVDDFELNKTEIKLYPNPTSNVLNIKMNQGFEKAEIYNVQGQKVLESNNKSMNVSKLSSGVYLITIQDKTGSVATKRFVKQ